MGGRLESRRRLVKNPPRLVALGGTQKAALTARRQMTLRDDCSSRINQSRQKYMDHQTMLGADQQQQLHIDEAELNKSSPGPFTTRPSASSSPGLAVNGTLSVTSNELYF